LVAVLRTWRRLRRYRGVFPWSDAALQLGRVLLPDRFHYRSAGRRLRQEAAIRPCGEEVYCLDLHQRGLRFYWRGQPPDHLGYLVEQEFDPRNPHCYTTPPVQLHPDSLILDVGACEGLFAFRVAKAGLARQVVCFEPDARLAELLRRGARDNAVTDRLTVESLAVSARSGPVWFAADQNLQAGRLVQGAAGPQVEGISLDDYCARHGLRPGPKDLIKIDAEGSDLDVLRGAEKLIGANAPQLAVTTYHTDSHCFEMIEWLNRVQPNYCLRLKGFAFWTERPRPVLLQAAR
jgi:FkbM family methyltransferase